MIPTLGGGGGRGNIEKISGNKGEGDRKHSRMRGVEKNISSKDAKFSICQPEVCIVLSVVGVVVGGVVRYVSFSSWALQRARLCAAAAAHLENKSFPTAPSANLFIPANNIWRC